MYFLEFEMAGASDFERDDSFLQEEGYLDKVDGAVSQTIARAIRDATQSTDRALQQEAASWLLTCCPDIAEQVELPELHYETMPMLAAAYVLGDSNI